MIKMFTGGARVPVVSNPNLAPEVELLLCCARTHIDQATGDRIQTLIKGGIDWENLQRLAAQHGVLPLLYNSLRNTCSDAIPASYFRALQQFCQANAQQNLLFTQELIRLLDLFEQQSISVLPFKGPLLALTVYHNLSLRQISDLDILVGEQDIMQAKKLLLEQGYSLRIEVPWEMHLIGQNGFHNIDLHNTIAPKHLSHPLRTPDIWQHIQPVTYAGRSVPNLSPEMTLFMLCLHGNKERWCSLNRICDVAELARSSQLNWQTVETLAKQWGMCRLIGVGLFLASNLLKAELPLSVWRWVQSDRVVVSLATEVKQSLFTQLPAPSQQDEVERTLFHIKTRERWRDKFWSFWGLMEHSGWLTPTPKDRAFLPLPQRYAVLYYLLRPLRILWQYTHKPTLGK